MSYSAVRWGVLGCARVFERRMVPGFRAAGNAELVAVASRSAEKAEATAAKHSIPRWHDSYESLLADPEIEAVFVPLPNDLHCEWTLHALKAGKHVLCDKPLCLSYADAKHMEETARTANLRLMEGFMWRHHPQHTRLLEVVRSGEIGPLRHFFGRFTYPAAPDPTNIRWHAEQGGGALLDVGVYPLNAVRYYFEAEPEAVTCAMTVDPSTGVDTRATMLLEWADGRTASLVGGFDQTFASRFEITGEKGSIAAERAFQIGEVGVTIKIQVGDETRSESFPHTDQYGLEIEHFSACVRDSSKSLAPAEDGTAQMRVVEALIRSAKEKRRVELTEIE
jgi:D-xylose 1-dehydrogenase (NADP+, D-xylono-1,5-lactone-forming)